MRLVERYIFRRAAGAFLLTLVALAGVVWVTQALRQMNIITAKGAALLVFLEITALALPFLVIIIAPFALLIAAVQTLNAFNAESELVVLNASGASRFVVLKPLMALAGATALVMMVLTTWGSPLALRGLRNELTKVNVDLVANIVQPGRFVDLEGGLTFHIRNRSGDGSLAGLFVEDRRDPATAFTYVAERAAIVGMLGKTLLVMRDGVIQRRTTMDGNLSLIDFESYAFDLSGLTPTNVAPTYRPSERPTAELWTGSAVEPEADAATRRNAGRLRAELHDRLSQPLLPLAFAVVAFLALGDARTTRQGRGFAIVATIAAAAALRGAHFAASSAAAGSSLAVAMLYAVPAATVIGGLVMVASDRTPSLPAPVERLLDAIGDGVGFLTRRLGERLGLGGGGETA
ncbi:MAG: LPS export ABC transporter permease LptF [Siculibacillus sp.]|nr:LPS export ABC transporter permease LptF [Siculibacillus sp.]